MKGEVGLLLVALLIRCLLVWQGSEEWLGRRIEITTPINQWSRIKEGIALVEAGVSPYAGDVFHETPIVLVIFQALYGLGKWTVGVFFVLLDFLVALCLAKISSLYHKSLVSEQREEKGRYGKGVDPILVKDVHSLPLFVAAVYLLNPLGILTCGGHSTIILTNLAVAFALWMILKGNSVLSALSVSVATYLSLYPVVLVFPFLIITFRDKRALGVARYVVCVVFFTALLLWCSFSITGSWEFLRAVHGVILAVPDFTPNVGLFWYFFTEAFEHFRVFFLCVFQINAFIYVIPLTIRFSNHPVFLSYLLLSLIAIFKSYPCVGDLAVPLSLLPLWSHVFRYLRYTLVVLCMFVVASVVGPVLWYLWVHAGSANANFFFALTLVYSLAQVFLLTDMIYSFMVYQYDLKNGLPRVDKEGKPISLRLAS